MGAFCRLRSQSPAASAGLRSTCMKWSSNGELSAHDLLEVLQRLASSDPNLARVSSCPLPQR